MTDDDEQRYKLRCPEGNDIVSTIEVLSGTAGIDEGSIRPADNQYGFDFEWDGYTDVNYDTQETVEVEKVRQFFCDAYTQHGEDELTLLVMDEEGEWVAPTKDLGLLQSPHDTAEG